MAMSPLSASPYTQVLGLIQINELHGCIIFIQLSVTLYFTEFLNFTTFI